MNHEQQHGTHSGQQHNPQGKQQQGMHKAHYKKLALMALLSFICMYILMYSMVNSFSNVFNNINQFYMAALMTMPMIIIEVVLMSSMYMNKKRNSVIIAVSSVALIAFYLFTRQQTAVNDKQFLRSMIPHHAGAILMCEKANIQDPEIKELCKKIRAGQQQEIDQMKSKLQQLENK
jgi:uncharacterized protein (DUF305 family)